MDFPKTIEFQSKNHPVIETQKFYSLEEYVLQLMHQSDYEIASKIARRMHVLDLGCNCGYGTFIMSRSATSVIGVDVSEEAVASALNMYTSSNLSFQVIDGRQLPFPSEQFDLVTSFQVIEHIEDYDTYFNEIRRVLRPRGGIVLSTPNAAIRVQPGNRPWNRFHVHEFHGEELKGSLSERFSKVTVLGCFADDEPYQIEYSRCISAREAAITDQNLSIMSRFAKYFPTSAVAFLKRLRTAFTVKASRTLLTDEQMQRFSTGQFFYRPDAWADSLNLIAICSSDEEWVRRVEAAYLQKRSVS